MRTLLTLCAAGLLSACGWHTGLVAPGSVTSVGVEIFSTRADLLERNLEPLLSDSLTRAVLNFVQTPLVAPEVADVVVRGEIVDYRRRSGTRNTSNQLVETGLYIAVRAELVDGRTGNVVVPALQRHVWSGYSLAGEGPENEAAARTRALDYVAETLVMDLFRARTTRSSKEQAQNQPNVEAPDTIDG